MEKERIYLTHITLHAKGFRPTLSFTKAAERGYMYLPYSINKSVEEVTQPQGNLLNSQWVIDLPQDLLEKMELGEIELMMPPGGPCLYVGKDLEEFIAKRNRSYRRQLIHRGRTWHAE